MKIKFVIEYKTQWGQSLAIEGSIQELGFGSSKEFSKMSQVAEGLWELEIEPFITEFEYKYLVINESDKSVIKEFGVARVFKVNESFESTYLKDYWRPNDVFENTLYTSPFSKSFFKRSKSKSIKTTKYDGSLLFLRFQLRAPRIGSDYVFGIIGSSASLGNWNESNTILMDDSDYPLWKVDISVKENEVSFEYKYVIYSVKEKKIVTWESGENRRFSSYEIKDFKKLIATTDEVFRYPVGMWKAAGVAVPVFSLRSECGSGVGEFVDIKKLVDWSEKTGLKVVQILPVNDTVATHTWVDSYPYAAISVQALHPIYASLNSIGALKDKKLQKEIDKEGMRLNKLDELDYEGVMNLKSKFFKHSFDEIKLNPLIINQLNDFIHSNSNWIIAYAVFSYLRDKYNTADFTKWGDHSFMEEEELLNFASPEQPQYDDIAVHYYIQFHLDIQLKEATQYARSKGIVLKGDIPIGIYRNSVDAWRYPQLFNMDAQSGAPPDDFSTTGQNWGFPTYNWEEMAEDNYSWWRNRMIKMSEYFDVFRIDHILGFFRIWEVPWEGVEGTLGRFNPSLPFGIDELSGWGIHFDKQRFCEPYIREYILYDLFGNYVDEVKNGYLDSTGNDSYSLKNEFNSQRKIKEYFDSLSRSNPEESKHFQWLKVSLFRLVEEVIFIESKVNGTSVFSPRISIQSSYSYHDLEHELKHRITEVYNHFYYHRHNAFWRKSAMKKLPMLKDTTDMLICGEDLGMVPASVPGVMDELQILSLAIQRMPNDEREFWHPSDTKYLSVTSTSSHDVSTLRGWWKEDRDQTQRFYNNIIGQEGVAPVSCGPELVKSIITQHLESPSMFAIFPIQDLIAMDGELQRDDPESERINVPKIINYYWKYRFHINLEDLLKEDEFNDGLKEMINQNGRLADY